MLVSSVTPPARQLVCSQTCKCCTYAAGRFSAQYSYFRAYHPDNLPANLTTCHGSGVPNVRCSRFLARCREGHACARYACVVNSHVKRLPHLENSAGFHRWHESDYPGSIQQASTLLARKRPKCFNATTINSSRIRSHPPDYAPRLWSQTDPATMKARLRFSRCQIRFTGF